MSLDSLIINVIVYDNARLYAVTTPFFSFFP